MAETGDTGPNARLADLQARLDTLRASGAAQRDPVRFAYLNALARRTAAQPDAIRASLHAKLTAELNAARELAARRAAPPTDMSPTSTASPLAELLAYISQHLHEPADATQFGTPSATEGTLPTRVQQTPELKSVAWFHETWSKLSTEQQLTQTLAQAPENAGPMNAQHLVLRSLQVMHDVAPDYLQGFMSYIDTLIWLEHAAPTPPKAARAPAGKGKSRMQ